MKLLLKIVGAVIALFAGLMILQMVASESGEVVVVATQEADGSLSETRLWVVDHDGSEWLRSGSPQAGWYRRMTANDQITVERDGVSQAMRAVPMVSERGTVNSLMADKYGWADQFIGMMFGRDDAIAIKLEPSS